MMPTIIAFFVTLLLAITAEAEDNWPSWRGPSGTGVAAETASPPTTWSDTENVRWKVPLPGRGHSTPVVWGDRIFVTAAVATGPKLPSRMSGRPGAHDNLPVDSEHKFFVIAIDRRSGNVLWEQTEHFVDKDATSETFEVREDRQGNAYAQFGDGQRGARLPSGAENVRAVYRAGLGTAGNVT